LTGSIEKHSLEKSFKNHPKLLFSTDSFSQFLKGILKSISKDNTENTVINIYKYGKFIKYTNTAEIIAPAV
jgi:hypothetical protein